MMIPGSKAMRRAALLAAMLGFAPSSAGRADDLHAKLEYCMTCHGSSGQGYRAFYTMPRLAGQQPKYIENQLRAFIEKRRTNPIMANVAHGLTPSMFGALAEHLHGLNPPPLGGAPRGQLDLGKHIFDEGLPESNVPACAACHGATAHGQDEIPRLAGQLHDYLTSKLTNWTRERGQDPSRPDISRIMGPTAHNLTPSQVAAVAAYVSTLK
jgi:cytochrome c553